jgi:hypothetical protein
MRVYAINFTCWKQDISLAKKRTDLIRNVWASTCPDLARNSERTCSPDSDFFFNRPDSDLDGSFHRPFCVLELPRCELLSEMDRSLSPLLLVVY